jgi:cephalosporin hydroxylase
VLALRHQNSTAQLPVVGKTFQDYYNSVTTGRGIWKWSNALDAYQRHFAIWAGSPVNFAEVGVQSGGSVQMWQGVLGPGCKFYGLDINPETKQFADQKTSITIGDQGNPAMWKQFFAETATSPLDVLVDDGGHEAHQMLTTLYEVWPHLSDGGFIAIEDIHGQHYIDSFFTPAANFLGNEAATKQNVASVHFYPFLMIAQRAGATPGRPASELVFAGTPTMVTSFEQLAAAIPHNVGGHLILENAGWGPFLTGAGLTNFFKVYASLLDYNMYDLPQGCATTSAAICSAIINNSPMQAQITGIHVYPTRLVVEVAGAPPTIQAVRKGTTWIGYG